VAWQADALVISFRDKNARIVSLQPSQFLQSSVATYGDHVIGSDMGIRFRCVHCEQQLNVKYEFAGKRGLCPHCRGTIEIPAETAINVTVETEKRSNVASPPPSITTAPAVAEARLVADPLSAEPSLRWYVATRGGPQFGPAQAATMAAWLDEGRITADSLVWREDWPSWRPATQVFPRFAQPSVAATSQSAAAATSPAVAAAGQQPLEAAVQLRTSADEGIATKQRRRRTRSKNLAATVVLAIVALVLIPVVWYVVVHR